VVLACGFTGYAFFQQSASDLLESAEKLVPHVSRIRGLPAVTPIQQGVQSREDISRFLNKHVRDNYTDQRLQAEGKVLQKLGLIPPTLDYKDFVLKLLTEQVGGYYDPDERKLFIAGWLPIAQQRHVLVHELTHALQDQHFGIGKILDEDVKAGNDDRALAHQALFEGDAMAVMLEDMLQPFGKSLDALGDLGPVMRLQLSQMDDQFEVFGKAPMYLKETLLFPYLYGVSFVQTVLKSSSWPAVNKVYADLPTSTEQVLHPEKYLSNRDEPQSPQSGDPAAQLGNGWKTTYRNVLGEFSVYLLLKLHLSEERARAASSGWDGDEVLLLEDGAGASAVFLSSVWDTSAELNECFDAVKEWLKLRNPAARTVEDAPGVFAVIHEKEYSSVSRSSAGVRCIIGLPESLAGKTKAP
jgi:hypothetical protein